MSNMSFDLSGQLALVTGANRGIGQAVALGLAAAGADIIGTARDAATCEVTRTAVEELGRTFTGLSLDLADPAAVSAFAGQVADTGHPDILVNNAGTILRAPAAEYPDDYWNRLIQVNLTSQFTITRDLGQKMIERGSGKVIFICSLLSYQGGIFVPGYTSAKSGLLGLTKALANEWSALGVNVNAVVPGYIATDNTSALRADPVRSKSILERIPAGRWGEPSDLAGAVVFLASPAAGYVHGAAIPVDGGWLGR